MRSPAREASLPPGSHLAIPRIFHQIWLGSSLPARFRRYRRTWQRFHPHWKRVLWTERTLPPLTLQRHFDQATSFAAKADIARLELLWRFGGVYVDTDFECLKPIDLLLGEAIQAFVVEERPGMCGTAILGAVPRHPFVAECLRRLPASIAAGAAAGLSAQSGPCFLDPIARQFAACGDVTLWPHTWFYPYYCGEPDPGPAGYGEAYGVHHWAASWVTSPPLVAQQRHASAAAQRSARPLAHTLRGP